MKANLREAEAIVWIALQQNIHRGKGGRVMMTAEGRKEIEGIISEEGGYVEDGIIKGCKNLYTHQLNRIIKLDGAVYYHEGEMRISNWFSLPKPKPELQQVIKFETFPHGDKTLALRRAKGADHHHIELWNNEGRMGYFHINEHTILWCPDGGSMGFMRLDGTAVKEEQPEQSRTVEVRPFNDVDYTMGLHVVNDDGWRHDHVEVLVDGEVKGYFHMTKKNMEYIEGGRVVQSTRIGKGEN